MHIVGNNKLANLLSFAPDETFDNHRWNFVKVCSEVKLLFAVAIRYIPHKLHQAAIEFPFHIFKIIDRIITASSLNTSCMT